MAEQKTNMTETIDLTSPSLYINRELSLLEFQRRVLEEAWDESKPLLERIKFLAIFGSNMDEFFMVRVSGIRKLVEALCVGPMQANGGAGRRRMQ
jgi:polyphosphate kinase